MDIEDDRMEICDGCDEFMFECSCEEEIDNILIRQKDYILKLISRGRLTEARCCLSCVSELWKANNYEYKTNEIIERIRKEKKEYKEPF